MYTNVRIVTIVMGVIFVCNSWCYRLRNPKPATTAKNLVTSKCRSDQHECGSLECVSEDLICDGSIDCQDGSDESACSYFPCPSYAFKCTYGACISPDLVCDGLQDCKDNSDENPYRCNNTDIGSTSYNCSRLQFGCTSGECIDDFNLCDGKADCADGTDETVQICTQLRCPEYAFRCEYGACINSDLRYDGRHDCIDGSDEKLCAQYFSHPTAKPKCSRNQFLCASGECIDDFDLCDGAPNCRDASDESRQTCSIINCPRYAFQCDYGACISANLRCNGRNNCHDGSDELNCREKPLKLPRPSGGSISASATLPPVLPTSTAPELPTSDEACVLPFNIRNGWNIIDPSEVLVHPRGTYAKKLAKLKFACKSGYALYPENATSVCNIGWDQFPVCIQTCPTIFSTIAMNVRCTLNQSDVSCERPKHGTTATMSCVPGYEDSTFSTVSYRLCQDGAWDRPALNCAPKTRFLFE